MQLEISQIIFIAIVFLSVSLWEFIMLQRNTTQYPYREGFAIFSLLQWIAIFLGMIGIFGLSWGSGIALFCIFFLQFICRLTIRPLWKILSANNYLMPTAIFSILVWVELAFGIYHFI